MGERGCDFFCFRECGDKYETHVMKKNIDSNEKLSLKKMSLIYSNNHDNRKALMKIKSVSKF
jgi:tRNA splicing endonuclease